jgi:hypothetical protein
MQLFLGNFRNGRIRPDGEKPVLQRACLSKAGKQQERIPLKSLRMGSNLGRLNCCNYAVRIQWEH